jgi:hypothetical protein
MVSRAFLAATRNERSPRHEYRFRPIMAQVEEPLNEHHNSTDEPEEQHPVKPSFTPARVRSFFEPSDFEMTYSNRDLLDDADDEEDDRMANSTADLVDEDENDRDSESDEGYDPSHEMRRFNKIVNAFS